MVPLCVLYINWKRVQRTFYRYQTQYNPFIKTLHVRARNWWRSESQWPPKAPSGTLNSAKSRVLVPGLTIKKKPKKNLKRRKFSQTIKSQLTLVFLKWSESILCIYYDIYELRTAVQLALLTQSCQPLRKNCICYESRKGIRQYESASKKYEFTKPKKQKKNNNNKRSRHR